VEEILFLVRLLADCAVFCSGTPWQTDRSRWPFRPVHAFLFLVLLLMQTDRNLYEEVLVSKCFKNLNCISYVRCAITDLSVRSDVIQFICNIC
jgi:hypothetical protein